MSLVITYGIKLTIEQLLELFGKQLKELIDQTFENPSMFPLDGINDPKKWEIPSPGMEDFFDYDETHTSWTLKKNATSNPYPGDKLNLALVKFSGYNNTEFLHEIFELFLYRQSITEVYDEYIFGVELAYLNRNDDPRINCMTDLVNDLPKEVKDKWQKILDSEIMQSNPKFASQLPKVYLAWCGA